MLLIQLHIGHGLLTVIEFQEIIEFLNCLFLFHNDSWRQVNISSSINPPFEDPFSGTSQKIQILHNNALLPSEPRKCQCPPTPVSAVVDISAKSTSVPPLIYFLFRTYSVAIFLYILVIVGCPVLILITSTPAMNKVFVHTVLIIPVDEDELLQNFLMFKMRKEYGIKKSLANKLFSNFSTLENVINADLEKLPCADGTLIFRGTDRKLIGNVQIAFDSIDRNLGVLENYIQSVGMYFIRRQIENISNLKLSDLRPNPFYYTLLKFQDHREAIKFMVISHVTRFMEHFKIFFPEKLCRKLWVGNDLWKDLSKEKGFHELMVKHLHIVSLKLLQERSIMDIIQNQSELITEEFEEIYGNESSALDAYLKAHL